MSKAPLQRILASIPENILLVKRNIDLYNELEEQFMPPEPAGQRKEALDAQGRRAARTTRHPPIGA